MLSTFRFAVVVSRLTVCASLSLIAFQLLNHLEPLVRGLRPEHRTVCSSAKEEAMSIPVSLSPLRVR